MKKRKSCIKAKKNGRYNNCMIKKERSLIKGEHNMEQVQVHPENKADLLGRVPQHFRSRGSYLSVLNLRLRNFYTNVFYFILLTQCQPTEGVTRSTGRLGFLVARRNWLAALQSSCRIWSNLMEDRQGSAWLG